MSLRLRLALWYGALTGVIVLLVSLAAYGAHTRAHYDDVDRALVGAVEHVVSRGATDDLQRSDLGIALAVPVAPDVVLRAYDPNGQVLAAAPGAELAPPLDPRAVLERPAGPPYDPLAGLAPGLMPGGSVPGSFGLLAGTDGERWRAYVLPAAASGLDATLVAAAPLGRIDESISAFRRLMLLGALVGAATTSLAGALMAGRALRPVATLNETARAIAASRDFAGRVPVAASQDELGRLATTFNAMLASLEAAYAAQQRFVAAASHELRAPLTAIQANLDLLQRQVDMPEAERREALDEAGREARRLTRLVADLLALARADAGVPLRQQPVELDRVLLDTIQEARHLARGQRLEVEHLEPTVVEGDPDRLKQLLLILADNAVKYTPPDGRVAFALRHDGKMAEVTVHDTGVGIPPEDLPRVFERFYRADPARARDPGGTGLGLPIARWIAREHGGEVALASEPGQGTTASVHLPLRH